MRRIFTIDRTVRTYSLYFDEHADVLRELLHSIARTLERRLPPKVSQQIDRQGCSLCKDKNGKLFVRRNPAIEDALHDLIDLGLFRIFAETKVGGYELPLAIYYLAVQLVSYFDTSLALNFLVHGNAMYIIERYGTEEQKRTYLPDLASGQRLATVAFTEPNAGSDAGSIRTTATLLEDAYCLSGNKLFITNGGDADILVTTARTASLDAGIHGVSTFIIEREVDGVEVVGLEDKTALNGSPTAALSYNNIRIPKHRLLGAINHGGEVMFAGVGMTRVNIGAQALGIAKRAFDAACDFALERQQGGCVIVEHDAIQKRLAEMALTISAMENLICYVSKLEFECSWHVREMSVAKSYCSEELQKLTMWAVNVFGGYGVSKDYPVERCRREGLALPLYGGTSEIHWFIICRELIEDLNGKYMQRYKNRDDVFFQSLLKRSTGFVKELTVRTKNAGEELWECVRHVAAQADPVPYYSYLAELEVSKMVAQVLLWQASDRKAGTFERELAGAAVDSLENQLYLARRRIFSGETNANLKSAMCALL